jgi:hypothetical protein
VEPDISILRKTGHFYFALTRIFHTNFPHEFSTTNFPQQSEYRSGLVRDLLDLFGGSPRLLVSNLLETGEITLKDLKGLQSAAPVSKSSSSRGGKGHA